MKTLINLNTWNRREHFLFFSKFEEPFFGVTVKVDCTNAYLLNFRIAVNTLKISKKAAYFIA